MKKMKKKKIWIIVTSVVLVLLIALNSASFIFYELL